LQRMVTEVVQQFWAAMARGEFITDAAAEAGTYRVKGARWLRAEGGVRPRRGRDLKGRAWGESMRAIARRLGRSPSTISRELTRNAGRTGGYRATTAHALAYARASRPKPFKLVLNRRLRARVEEDLRRRYAPEQIVGRLRRQFPDDL
jgi:IS30 family transposase